MHVRFARLKTAFVFLVTMCALISPALTSAAHAGALNGNANAYAGWTGSTPFVSGTLKGFVDYAVFAPGNFPYGGGGYTPTAGEMVYTYQIFVTGTAPLSAFSIDLNDLADNVGAFNNLGGQPPLTAVIVPGTSVDFTFAGVPQGSMTYGLAFSSPKLPMTDFGSVVDTGQSAFVIPLPSPGPNDIPEPASLSVLALCGLGLCRRTRRA